MTDDPRDLASVKTAVLHAAKTLHQRGLVEGTAGNVSGRVADGTVVMTPSSLDYADMVLDDLVVVTPAGEVISGDRSPTSEKALHLACYRDHAEVGGVVHCHAKHASMFAVARTPIPAVIDEFVIYIGGDVPVCDYEPSGTDELGDEVARKVKDRSAALMSNHGMCAIGKNVHDALHNALVVEHNAEIIWGAAALGGAVPIGEPHESNFRGIYDFVRGNIWPRHTTS